ncbi:relaxase/mobilization nuclease domain-containing protein [Pseudomonas aeruginosa]|uniref:relaxase/mobilization nuclease domain-containing protein n=1 Tax=Pseudomonas aeruginosa TaxID=287 RepID=UPI0032E3C367
MIRKKISTQKSKPEIYKTAKYFNREDGCVLFETNIYIPINASKAQMASAISKSIEGDIKGNRKGRKQSVKTQHDVVSYHTDDKLTPEQAKSIAKELYEKTHNLSNRKYALGVHIDTDEIHVHIVWAIKDFDGKCYNVGNDYRKIERECENLENKHGLIKPKNRISRDIDKLDKMKDLSPEHKKEIIANKYQDKHLSANERMLDVRGIVSNKQQMKDALKPYLDNAFSPSDFIDQITENGFNVIHNGKSSYSIQFDDQIFKASELNLSYKSLKMKLGEDEEFERTLSRKHHVKKQEEDCFLLSSDTQPDFMSKVNPKSVLRTKFKYEQHNDKVEYFYNTYNSKKSFEYYKDPSKVLFNDTSRQSAKAGLQRLLADSNPPSTFTVSGGNHFKKNIWLEFQLMGLEAKGFTLEGYQPKPADLEELKKIQEQYASMNKKVEPKAPTVAIEAPKPTQPLPTQDEPNPLKNDIEQPAASGSDEPKKQVEQEQVFIEGDYSTYTTNQLCDEMEDIISRIDRRCFIGNSSNDIDGHRRWDSTHKDYVEAKPPNERKQYYLRQELYEVFDEIRNRNPSLANDLDSEFKKAMKYKSSFKPVYE